MINLVQELPIDKRADAVNSIVYEASARMRDPVYGCVGTISFLQNEVSRLEMQLAKAQAEILSFQMRQQAAPTTFPTMEMDLYDQDPVFFSHPADSSNSINSFQEVEDYCSLWT